MAGNARQFKAVLERGDRALGWTVARVPFDPSAAWSHMVRLRIRGEIEGPLGVHSFRSSLFKNVDGDGFCILVNRGMQREAGLALGAEAVFRLEADLDDRPAELPEDLAAMLDEEEGLRAWYERLTEYTRREIGKWVHGAKGESEGEPRAETKRQEARLRRAIQMAERLLSTMEAETELPPLIERAFRARPRARLGWGRMTETQRRAQLMGVFYYQTPEARERRVAKLCEIAEQETGNTP